MGSKYLNLDLFMTNQETAHIRKIHELEQRLQNLERSNQIRRIVVPTDGEISTNIGTVIDGLGLNSAANFPSDQIINPSTYSTSSTSLVDVPGSTMDSFTLTRETKVLVLVQAQIKNDNFVVNGSFAELVCTDSIAGDLITFDAACKWRLTNISEDSSGFLTGWSMDTFYEFNVIGAIFTMAAGTHSLKLRYRVDGSGNADIGLYVISYIILGS